jgi:hypothetical protein
MTPQLPREEVLAALANPDPNPDGNLSAEPQPETPTLQPAAAAASSNGRDTHGRFVKGNDGGPGNPFARQTAALRKALLEAVTPEDITQMAHTLMIHAKQGDLGACKLLFSYILGKPQAAIDPDTLDRHEWNTWFQRMTTGEELQTLKAGWPLSVLCAMAPALLQSKESTFTTLIRAVLETLGPLPPDPTQPQQVPAAAVPPSTNGPESAPPSTNGETAAAPAAAPSTNGETALPADKAPSTTGPEMAPPSANGPTAFSAGKAPSTNGLESVPPSTNGPTAHAQPEAPSTNGDPQRAEPHEAEPQHSKPRRRSWMPFLLQTYRDICAGKYLPKP